MFSLAAIVQRNTTQNPDRTTTSIALSIFFIFVLFNITNAISAISSEPNSHVITVKRYGVEVRTPSTWLPVVREQEDRAFVLLLPQPEQMRPAVVACEIAVAPSELEQYQIRISENTENDSSRRQLVHNRFETITAQKISKDPSTRSTVPHQLSCLWKFQTEDHGNWFELKIYRIENNQLYTFILNAHETYFSILENNFRIMNRTAVFQPPETGLRLLPGGYWMQRDYHFGMKLPKCWKPSFPISERVTFFASGKIHDVFSDNLIVVARQHETLNFNTIIESFPEKIAAADQRAKIIRLTRVNIKNHQGVESVIETQRGPFRITILQRRIQGSRLNYDIIFTVVSDEFKGLEAAIIQSADSFTEFPIIPKRKGT